MLDCWPQSSGTGTPRLYKTAVTLHWEQYNEHYCALQWDSRHARIVSATTTASDGTPASATTKESNGTAATLASRASRRQEHATDMLYSSCDGIFSLAAPLMLENGWSVWPQQRKAPRRPARIDDHTLEWMPFQTRLPTAEEMAKWCEQASQANVACALGAASGNLFALDIDCLDAAVSGRVQAIAESVLGHTPLQRIGRAPKMALFYRYDEGGSPRSRTIHFRDYEDCSLEVLGARKAVTLHGIHHVTGRYYHWPETNPLLARPDEAPEVSAAAVDHFLEAVEREFPFKEPPRSAAIATGIDLATVSTDGIAVVAHAVEGARLADGREAWLRDTAWNTVRRNAEMLSAAHAAGNGKDAVVRVAAAVAEAFGEACVLSGRWNTRTVQTDAVEKVGRAVEKLLAGDTRPWMERSVPGQTATAEPASLWQNYLDVGSAIETAPPPLDFVLPGILAGTLAVLVSPGGAGKSMLALGLGACVAAGRSMWGLLHADPVAGNVIVVSAEDPKPILAHRLHALAHVPGGGVPLHGDAGFRERFRVKAVQGTGFSLGSWSPAGFQPSPAFEVLNREVCELRPRLVIIDTLNRCLAGIPENDNAALGRVISALEAMVAPVGGACLVLHHVGKSAAREGAGDEQQAARGAGAITDNARWQGNLVGLTREDAAARGMPDDERRRWVRMAVSKSNYAPGLEDKWLWRDQGGVLVARPLPPLGPAAKAGAKASAKGLRNYDPE